jgi:hypothetical protein
VLGEHIANITRAWQTCVLRANGFTPSWDRRPHEGTDIRANRRQGGRLTRELREAFARIDLHFHDLRREAGSRWMEGGMPLHVVQKILGHADVRTTSIYLDATRIGLHESMQRFEQLRRESCTDVAQEASQNAADADATTDENLLDVNELVNGAGDGDRTRDIELGKLAFYR